MTLEIHDMTVTIHQPEHLIWLGLIDKISRADVFVILDNVQYEKNYFQNRNKIKTNDGWTWLTVPIKKQPLRTKIKDIEISTTTDWTTRYLDILRLHYKNSPYFNDYYNNIEAIIKKPRKYLSELNRELLEFTLQAFNIKCGQILLASELDIPDTISGGSNVVLEICKILKTDHYLSGPSGKDYLNLPDFEKNNIKVTFHDFHHPQYEQMSVPFLPFMSSVDALFNQGRNASKLIHIQ